MALGAALLAAGLALLVIQLWLWLRHASLKQTTKRAHENNRSDRFHDRVRGADPLVIAPPVNYKQEMKK